MMKPEEAMETDEKKTGSPGRKAGSDVREETDHHERSVRPAER